MLTALLPITAFALANDPGDPTPVRVSKPAEAQRLLADAIGTAESVDFVRATPGLANSVTFGIDRAGEAYELVATTDASGRVIALQIDDLGAGTREPGRLSWLTDVMKDAASVTRLVVDAEGTVVLVTREGERYQALPGRVARDRTNAAVRARWAAAWEDA